MRRVMSCKKSSLHNAEKLQRQMSAVRQRKIKQLKTKIAAGRYEVNNMRLAIALFMAQ